MKICPICKAATFDDAGICFGCMHRFEDEEASGEQVGQGGAPSAMEQPVAVPPWQGEPALPAFYIKMVPVVQGAGGVSWACSVEMAEA